MSKPLQFYYQKIVCIFFWLMFFLELLFSEVSFEKVDYFVP